MKRRTLFILGGLLVAALGSFAAAEKSPQTQQGGKHAKTLAPVPREATALCVDGTWSSAESSRGACSAHGGVKAWFGKPPKGASFRCKDGTYSESKESHGACSNHGGIAFKLKETKPAKEPAK